MKTVTVSLESLSPYGQSGYIDEVKGDRESHHDFECRIWKERGHWNKAGKMFIPAMSLKNCLTSGAKYCNMKIPGQRNATFTKPFVAGISCAADIELPVTRDDLQEYWLFVPSDGKPGGGSRVKKSFPMVPAWKGAAQFYILDDVITETVFEHVVERSGLFIGLGFFRPERNGFWGRFKPTKFDWS